MIAANSASVTVSEGATANNTGTWSDANPGNTVTLSASVGTVVKAGTNALGTWSWSFGTSDGPDQTQTVTITANDGQGGSTSTTFGLTVNNVAPTVALSTANDLSVNEGPAQHTYSYTISDPGADTVTSVSTSCGANGVKVTGSDTNTDTSGSFKCTFADGPASSTVSAQATDSDGEAGNTATQTVSVANVAPTVVLSGAASVNEGSVHTYTYTVSDPGQDTFTYSAGFNPPICGSGGVTHATSTVSGGTFSCFFPDGPASTNVAIKVDDSDGAASNTATQTVAVANVAPTVVLSGAASVNEGSTHTYTYTVSDPGQDTFTVSAGYPTCGTGGSVTGTPSTTTSGGSFNCFFPDGPDSTNVAIKVADSDGASGTDSESVVVVQVANVEPSVSRPADQAANEGASTSFNLGSFSDPGPDSPWTVDVDWGDGSPHGTATKATTGSLGSMSHTYADGPAGKEVTIRVTDTNGGVSSAQSFMVTVANVAPTVVLSAANDLAVNEDPAQHTYSYTISDPGVDTVSVRLDQLRRQRRQGHRLGREHGHGRLLQVHLRGRPEQLDRLGTGERRRLGQRRWPRQHGHPDGRGRQRRPHGRPLGCWERQRGLHAHVHVHGLGSWR